jgi:transposase InsO family protein
VILDVFSRYAVGWTVQHRENYLLAKDLIAQVCEQQHIKPKQLTVHADRGSLMTPDAVHHGRADAIHADRARVLAGAYAVTPERFAQRPPRPPPLPTAAWINKAPTTNGLQQTNFATTPSHPA